jgi:hypothetical protein
MTRLIQKYVLLSTMLFLGTLPGWSQNDSSPDYAIRRSPVSYHLSFDDDTFFAEDFIEASGKKSIEERKIDFPEGRFGKGIRMREIPETPDANNMTGIDLDLVTAVIFNTHPGNQMGFNQPFIWGSGRINARLGGLAFWARGALAFAGPLFEQTSVGFGRKERDLLGVVVDENNFVSAYIRDARYVRHTLKSEAEWNPSNWNHVVLNWDWANGMELWINGEKVASSWGEQAWFETTNPGLFHLPAAGVTYDEFYIFDRPITPGEIKNLIASNTFPKEESILYERAISRKPAIAEVSGASLNNQLPVIQPGQAMRISEVWPQKVGDDNIPGWHIVDGRNEIAWPHPYSMFTIIPGDADFKAEKVDIQTGHSSKVNYITMTGNLTNVQLQASTQRSTQKHDLFTVPSGNQFFYGSKIKLQEGADFRIPFTEAYGTPAGFSGDVHLPLSGKKRIQNIGLYHYQTTELDAYQSKGDEFALRVLDQQLDKRTHFAIHALTSRDERQFVQASATGQEKEIGEINIGNFSRLNIVSEPYQSDRGIKSISLSLPIKTNSKQESLFIRVRDPAVPSRFWNQFALKLTGFDQEYQKLQLTIDFQDIVVSGGDRLWIDLGTAENAKVLLGSGETKASLYVEETETYLSIDAYVSKEMASAQAQYSKMYEFMPWQFTGKEVSLTEPYCYGGPFDMIMPALAINRTKPDHFFSNYLIKVCGPDFKDGKPIAPRETPLITLPNPLNAPEWALYMHDFNLKRESIVNWWSDKQNKDGQLGGGWNDDVLFLSYHQPDLPLDGNENARFLIDAAHKGLEKTNYFKDGYCNIYPMDRMHIGDFISERYNTVLNNLGQAYAFERELESAWRLGKIEETPINYFADGFKSSVNILNWFWGHESPQLPYVSKDLDELTSEFQLYTSVLDEYAYFRFTGSNVHRDDYAPYGANNMYTYLLGGRRGTRLDAHMELAVTWPSGGGADLPRVVLYADDTRLDVLAYSFDDNLRELNMRLCRITDGRYRIAVHEYSESDRKNGKILWKTEQHLKRFDVVTLPIPGHTSVKIEVQQLSSAERPGNLPDLAIDPWDAVFDDGSVSCTIHNLGNGVAENLLVRLYDGEKVLQERTLAELRAPTDFTAKREIVIFDDINFSGNLHIVIDPEHNIQEILKDNNRAFVYEKGGVEVGLVPKTQGGESNK